MHPTPRRVRALEIECGEWERTGRPELRSCDGQWVGPRSVCRCICRELQLCAPRCHMTTRATAITRESVARCGSETNQCAAYLELSDIHFAVQMMTRLMHCNAQRVDA